MNPYALQIYTDGSCPDTNPGVGGLAVIALYPDSDDEPKVLFKEGYEKTTIARMEIKALIKAIDWVKNNRKYLIGQNINYVEIWSDSENALTCYYDAEKWRANNWLGANEQQVGNVDLLKSILTLKSSVSFNVSLYKIKGKSTKETRIVDKLAKEAARGNYLHKDGGYIIPRISRTLVDGKIEWFQAEGQEVVIRVFSHVPISRRKQSLYKIGFEVKEGEAVKKCYAYASQELNNVIDRWHYYKAVFNNNPRNPTINSMQEVSKKECNFN